MSGPAPLGPPLAEPPPPGRPGQPDPPVPDDELARDEHWQRLDPRMLLVHPIREVVRFLPVLAGVFIAGTTADGPLPWHYLGVLVPIALGLLRYLTTRFRVSAERVELRRGLLSRHLLSTPLDRVRTVDLTSSLVQRLLGLTTVRVGTGTASATDETQLDLDGLPVDRARALREALLRVAPTRGHPDPAGPATPGAPTASGEHEVPGERVVVRLDPSWVRFAPLTSSGLVITAGVLGAAAQLVNLGGGFRRLDAGRVLDSASTTPVWLALPIGLVVLLAVVSALAIGGYLVANWGFTLSHTRSGAAHHDTHDRASGGAWRLTRGLLTTRETTLDQARLAGVVLDEPLGLRLVGGARLSAIVTGLDSSARGGSSLVPPAPAGVVRRVGAEVLGRTAGAPGPAEGPLTGALAGHGPAARRRRYIRALVPAGLATGAATLGVILLDASGWVLLTGLALPAALLLAADRARSLGHALRDGYVVSRSGSLNRRREALWTDDVIGWNFRATWFQRRVGLTSLVATTAGGRQSVTVPDVPAAAAVALAGAALPELLGEFMAHES